MGEREAILLINVFGSPEPAITFLERCKEDTGLIDTLCRMTGAIGYSLECLDDLIWTLRNEF